MKARPSFKYGILLLVGSLLATCSSDSWTPLPSVSEDLIRKIQGGQVVGFVENDTNQWRGIAYAAPPVGNLRWRPPQSPPTYEELFEANQYGQPCKQIGHPLGTGGPLHYGKPIGDEDCLTLNIFAPQDAKGPVPVMMWIHGGSNMVGTAADYDFSTLAREEQVLVVTVNYRLGIFGWFSHPIVRQEATGEQASVANFALLDLLAALGWIRDNIAIFGGDPKRVTAFGESAGAHNVLGLVATPLRDSTLIRGAIAQSGNTRSVNQEMAEAEEPTEDGLLGSGHIVKQWVEDHPLIYSQDEAVIKAEVTRRTGDPLIEDPELSNIIRQSMGLRSLDANYIIESLHSGQDDLPNLPRMIEDGVTIYKIGLGNTLEHPLANPLPLMLGTNRDETKLFTAFDPDLVNNWFDIQYLVRNESLYERINSYGSKAWKEAGADRVAEYYPHPAWVYRFDWDEEPAVLFTDFSKVFGAAHALEIPLVSGSMSLNPAIDASLFSEENLPAARALSKKMMAYWANFARIGAPGDGDGRSVAWTPYRLEHAYLVFDTPTDGGIRMERDRETLETLLGELAADTSIPEADEAQRCELLWMVLGYSGSNRLATLDQYRAWESGRCADMEPQAR